MDNNKVEIKVDVFLHEKSWRFVDFNGWPVNDIYLVKDSCPLNLINEDFPILLSYQDLFSIDGKQVLKMTPDELDNIGMERI